jgi:hypothetical protein
MAQLTAETTALKLQYQLDGKNNLQEAPGAAIVPADGSTAVAASIGKSVNIFTIPQPGHGFPTGKDATHSTGTYPRLVKAVIQQSTDTVSVDAATRINLADPDGTSAGMSVIADAHSHAGVNDLQNSIENDTSNMVVVASRGFGSNPTPAAGTAATDGLSQSPETLG